MVGGGSPDLVPFALVSVFMFNEFEKTLQIYEKNIP